MRNGLILIIVLFILNTSHVIFINIFTHSLPSGLYIRIGGTPQRGDYAVTCLTPEIASYGMQRGYLAAGMCTSGTVPVLKIIKGLPADNFIKRKHTVIINGEIYPLSTTDSKGRLLRVFYQGEKNRIGVGRYFLLSNFVTNSWDSRYWGPVSILFRVKPLLIFR